jgi:hypothetical protein
VACYRVNFTFTRRFPFLSVDFFFGGWGWGRVFVEDTVHTSSDIGGACSTYRGEFRARFRWGNLKERDHLGDVDIERGIIVKLVLKSIGIAWTGLNWLRIGTSDRVL